jgi:hypothetical protein
LATPCDGDIQEAQRKKKPALPQIIAEKTQIGLEALERIAHMKVGSFKIGVHLRESAAELVLVFSAPPRLRGEFPFSPTP